MGIIVPADIYVLGCPLNLKLWLMAFFNFKKKFKEEMQLTNNNEQDH